MESVQKKVAYIEQRLQSFYKLHHVGDVRQAGLMVGIELVKDVRTKEAYDPGQRVGAKVIAAAREKGVMIRPLGDVVVLMPPLSITEDELRLLLDVVHDAIEEVTG